jgi:citrate lyase subunit beta/citryl-CoA lyase
MIAAAAASRGLMAIGFPGSIANFRDLDRHARGLKRGRDLGMTAAGAIHPAQLPNIRTAFASTPEEHDWAKRVITAAKPGSGVTALAGEMIDAPVLARARRILGMR